MLYTQFQSFLSDVFLENVCETQMLSPIVDSYQSQGYKKEVLTREQRGTTTFVDMISTSVAFHRY